MPNDISNRQPGRLIARETLFGNPTFAMCRISPDGEMLSWLAPLDGVLNVWLAPRQAMQDARAITADRLRGIRQYTWSRDGRHILYMQDVGGDEDWHVYSVEISSRRNVDLSPSEGITAHIAALSWDAPGELIIAINDRDAAWHDFYRVDITTGERQCVLLNEHELSNVVFDRAFVPRIVERSLTDGGRTIMRYDDGIGEELYRVDHEDYFTTHVVGFEADNGHYYLCSSIRRDKAALIRVAWGDGAEELLGEHDRADIGQILLHPTEHTALAYSVYDLKLEWFALNKEIAGDLDFLRSNIAEGFQIVSRSRGHDRWIIVSADAQSPGGISYLYDRNDRSITRLFSSHPELQDEHLAAMHPVVLATRDGYEMVSYLSLPPDSDPHQSGRPGEPLAMVLVVHGGPWSRDGYGFNPEHLWLADRGYAVLSVNFRGSTGFGKAFINAGDLEWGRKMHDDLLDAVEWAIGQGIADRSRVAIMGGSYGGYATLAGLAFTPDRFACGVDIVGPSNLETLLATVPAYWQAFLINFTRRVGDPRTEEGRALLRERSPLYKADQIVRPLLIGQGANDPRVKQAESDQIVSAMQAKELPVIYALYTDEGHGFARPENRLSFFALTEAFLGAHLGGSVEPLGESLAGTSLDVRAGADLIAGLDETLAKLATNNQ